MFFWVTSLTILAVLSVRVVGAVTSVSGCVALASVHAECALVGATVDSTQKSVRIMSPAIVTEAVRF